MFEQVKDALVESLNIEGEDIKLESNLKDDLGIDSLAAVELSLDLETEFDVEISDEELEKRRANFKPLVRVAEKGLLGRYAKLVQSAKTGAVLK